MPFFVTGDNVKIYYEEQGKGKPVILIHGLTAGHRHFRKQIPELSRHYRVIAPDLRGHGHSDRPKDGLTLPRLALDMRELILSLDLRELTLVGWSMGAHVIFEYVKQFQCIDLNNIAIIDMSPKIIKSEDWNCGLRGISGLFGDFTQEDNLLLMSIMSDNWARYSALLIPRLFNRSHCEPGVNIFTASDFPWKDDLDWLYEEAKRNTPHVIIFLWLSLVMQDYRPQLAEIDVPCLLAWGRESNYYGEDNYEYMKAALVRSPEVSVVPFEGCGHALHIQDPERFNHVLMDFMGKGAATPVID
ncbi:MAG: alpha/beta hydrolase [Syntrophales bacterium]|nr:alpha/beta hydrolase [Syntrophales bacterium]